MRDQVRDLSAEAGALTAHSYAQTNIQLFNQLLATGFADDDLQRVADAYELAMPLFSGAFRANGKPFLSHLVGTASILATIGQPGTVVAAGLLHAAYELGDFGDGRGGITASKRDRLRQAVGDETEELVALFAQLDWRQEAERAASGSGDLSPRKRAVLIMRLANQLEDRLDLGMLYCGKSASKTTRDIDIAKRIGAPALAAQLQAWTLAAESGPPAPALARAAEKSFTLAPASYRRGYDVLARHAASAVWGRLRQLRRASAPAART